MDKTALTLTCLLLASSGAPGEAPHPIAERDRPRVLFVGLGEYAGGGVLPSVDPVYRRRLYDRGYTADACTLGELLTPGFERLRRCNVLVLTQFMVGQAPFTPEAMETLRRFVEEGGGLLLMGGLCGYGDHLALVANLNQALAPFDGRLLYEEVTDPRHTEVYDKGLLTYHYYWTEGVLEGHPVTRGIRRLWYPGGGGQHAAGPATSTLAVGRDWTILVRGSDTARSSSYPARAPLVAAREYGRGRIALMPCDPRYSINEGYHPAYGRFIEKGDLFRFLCQLYDWLGEPSIRAGRHYPEAYRDPAAPASRPAAPTAPPPDLDAHTLLAKALAAPRLPLFRGVIGLQSDLSTGASPVEALCREARALGYQFVVFAENYGRMDEAKWGQLVARCKAESHTGFLALPGLHWVAPEGERIAFHLARFPRPEEAGAGPELLFNQGWPTVILSQPGRNRYTAWQHKFYTGLALYTYEGGQKVDDATALYRRLSASDYRLIPVAVNKVRSLGELRATRGQVVTCVHARSLDELAERPDWEHGGPLRTIYGCGTSHVSSGPVLEAFAVATAAGTRSYAGAYESAPGQREVVSFRVRSEAPLREVLLFRGDRLYRRLLPNTSEFAAHAVAASDRNDSPFSLFARDARGRVLQSNALRCPYNPSFCYSMCVDKQNSIIVAGDIGMTAGWIAGYDTGALFPPLAAEGIVPAGEDASWCPVSSLEMRPEFGLSEAEFRRLAGPDTYPLAFRSRRCLLSHPDCVVTEDTFEQGFVRARIRTTSLRPRLRGLSAMVVEQWVRITRDMDLPQPRVTLVRLMTNTAINLYPHYAWEAPDGSVRSGDVDRGATVEGTRVLRSLRLRPGGWIALHGSPAGAVATCALSPVGLRGAIGLTDYPLHAFVSGKRASRNYLELSRPVPGGRLRAGTEWRSVFLVLLDCRDAWTPDQLAALSRTYALRGGRVEGVRVTRGRRDPSRVFPLTLRAMEGGATVRLARGTWPMDLPVAVCGLNPHWDALVCSGRGIRRLGVAGTGEGCALLASSERGPVYLGHPVVCSHPLVRVNVDLKRPGRLRITLHNPTHRPTPAIVRRAPGFPGCADFRRRLVMAPGQTVQVAACAAPPDRRTTVVRRGRGSAMGPRAARPRTR